MSLVAAPRWDAARIDADVARATRLFAEERVQEPLERYADAVRACRSVVEELLAATGDLAGLADMAAEVMSDGRFAEAVRYLAGPPVSADDLGVIARSSLAPGRMRNDPEAARRVVGTVLLALDHARFPWLVAGRSAGAGEREAAVVATATLLATRRVMTDRAHESKTAQEAAVRERLRAAGYRERPTPAEVATVAQAPADGEFFGRETVFGERKADLLVGLPDGRKMPIECKVSNSSTNSIKRVRDASEKAERWRGQFGSRGVVPAGVLAGVFRRETLLAAQGVGLTIFWAHDLDEFLGFIARTGPRAAALFP